MKLNPNKKPRAGDGVDGGNEADTEHSASSSNRTFVLHRQQAIHGEAGSIMDVTKQQRSKKGNKVDELTREDNLSLVARVALQDLATEFTQGCFNRELTPIHLSRHTYT